MPTGRYALVMSDEPATARFQRPALTTTGEFVKEGALNGAILPIFIGAALAQASPNLGGPIILGGGLAAAPAGEIGSPQIFLIASSSREWNPELSLKVAVYVRLVRLSDGDESRVARSR